MQHKEQGNMHNEGTPRYDGPRELAQSLTALAHSR